jgi:predicted ArsR family transcriptional regulator
MRISHYQGFDKALTIRIRNCICAGFELVEMVGHKEKWITALIDGLDKSVDEKTMAKILEQCGRQCQSQNLIKKARSLYEKSKSTDEFLDKLGKVCKHLHKGCDNVNLVYPRCYCSQVNKIPKGKLSGIYCNCSRGWAKALFEGALGRDIEVTKEKSIISGDCREMK